MQRLPSNRVTLFATSKTREGVQTTARTQQTFATMTSLCLAAQRPVDAQAWLTELISSVIFSHATRPLKPAHCA
jgi:hypothetical protein